MEQEQQAWREDGKTPSPTAANIFAAFLASGAGTPEDASGGTPFGEEDAGGDEEFLEAASNKRRISQGNISVTEPETADMSSGETPADAPAASPPKMIASVGEPASKRRHVDESHFEENEVADKDDNERHLPTLPREIHTSSWFQ